jgi:hypothetical protein
MMLTRESTFAARFNAQVSTLQASEQKRRGVLRQFPSFNGSTWTRKRGSETC